MPTYTDYLMPYGWGDSTSEEDEYNRNTKRNRSEHPINKLNVGESYRPKNKTDSNIAHTTAYRLRKERGIDIKSKNGIFTRIK